MDKDFSIPDFMDDDEKPKEPFFEEFKGTEDQLSENKVVFVFQSQEAPVLPSGESHSTEFPSLTQEELIGLYVTTNAMMNLLIKRKIFTQSELSKMITEIKRTYLDYKG